MKHALCISAAAGAVAGTLDIVYALVVYGALGVAPVRIFQSIASGLLGPDAYDGGLATAVLGGVLHFAMAAAMAGGYLVLSGRVDGMRTAPLVGGLVYGIALFFLMYLVVVPLSAATVTMPSGLLLGGSLFAHTVLVGIPIALVVRCCSAARA